MEIVDERFVILVHKNYNSLPRLEGDLPYQFGEATGEIRFRLLYGIFILIEGEKFIKKEIQLFLLPVFPVVEIEIKNRILLPVPIHSIGIQTFEQFALSLEEAFERVKEKTLPEATRTAEDVILRSIDDVEKYLPEIRKGLGKEK